MNNIKWYYKISASYHEPEDGFATSNPRHLSQLSGWILYLIGAFGNPNHCQVAQHKFFRSGQVFGVQRGFVTIMSFNLAQGFVQVTRRNANVEIPTSRAVATSQRPSSQVPCRLRHCRHWRWTSRNHHRSPQELQQSWGVHWQSEIIFVGLRKHACPLLAWSFKSWHVTINVWSYSHLPTTEISSDYIKWLASTSLSIHSSPRLLPPNVQAALAAKSLVTFCRSNLGEFHHVTWRNRAR